MVVQGEGEVLIHFPLFDTDGKNITEKSIDKKCATVTYNGFSCKYATDGIITDEDKIYANRNGHYKACIAAGENCVTLKIEISVEFN